MRCLSRSIVQSELVFTNVKDNNLYARVEVGN